MTSPSFTSAAYAFDGQFGGARTWLLAQLSPRWTEICRAFIEANGPVLDSSLGGPLGHLHIQGLWNGSAATYRISVNGEPVVISALVSGGVPERDLETLKRFAGSAAKAAGTVVEAGTSPFAGVLDIEVRPLLASVFQRTKLATDQDASLATELNLHLAAAYLLKSADALTGQDSETPVPTSSPSLPRS